MQCIELKEPVSLAMDNMGVAVTLIDKKGTSNKKFDSMIQDFRNGRKKPFHCETKPYEKIILVTLSPIFKDGKFFVCIQSVQLKEDIELKYNAPEP